MKTEEVIKYVEESLSSVYCDSCKNNEIFNDDCDYCHRKYMMWGISHETAESIVSGIVKILENDWIPCKKKPPEDFEWVYAQTIYGEHIVTKYVPPKIKPESHPHGYWGDTDYFDVVAWRHLPEAYTGDKDDFNNKRFDS